MSKSSYVYVTISFLICYNCFTFQYFPSGPFLLLMLVASLIFLFFKSLTKPSAPKNFQNILLLLYFASPLMTMIPCYLYHGQDIILSLRSILLSSYGILIYWYLHSIKASSRSIVKLFLIFATIWTAIEIIQQFTFPVYLFASRDDLEQRSSCWRFMIQPWHVGFIACLYSWFKYLEKGGKWIWYFVFFSVGVFLYLTRVILFSTIGLVIFSIVLTNRISTSNKIKIIISVIVLCIPLIIYSDVLFGDFVELTTRQVSNEDNIRYYDMNFYGVEYFPNDVCRILGNGIYNSGSKYGKEIAYLEQVKGWYRGDVGLVGDYNMLGLPYILFIFMFYFKLFKMRKCLDNYQLYILFGLLLGSYVMPPFRGNQSFIIGMLLYLCDASYNTRRLKLRIK